MPDSAVRAILRERVDHEHQSIGIVVGVVEPAGRRTIAFGRLSAVDSQQVDANTIFEIGSISKVFTSLLLADMVRHNEVNLSDPVSKFLPSTVTVPTRGNRVITLVDLATHSSALPPMPTNFTPANNANPFADYTPELLYKYLSSAFLTRDIGAQFEYSNLGGGLLGHALSRRAGIDYETLVRSRILEPLGMSSTRISLSPEQNARFATGHSPFMRPVQHWDFAALAAAGAWRSSANDLLNFLSANLGFTPSPLDSAMAAMREVNRPGPGPASRMGLGWFMVTPPGHEFILHGGTTAGFQTFIAFDLHRRVGVVVLSNAGTPQGIQDIGMHLLDESLPLFHPATPKAHLQIDVDSAVLIQYVGRYELRPGVTLAVTRDGAHIFAQVLGQNRFELFAESKNAFFAKVADIQFVFETDSQNRVLAVVQHQMGITQHWQKID